MTGPRTAALTLLCVVAAAATPASPADGPRDVSALLRPIREEHDLPGLVALTLGPGGIEAQGADGVRRRGGAERIAIGDRMHLGSCTKAMTATLCALLVADGKLRWDASPATAFEGVKDVDPGWGDATLEDLLRNRGGAPANLDADGLWARLFAHRGTGVEQRRALVEGVLRRAPAAKPGTAFVYSNAGFAVAGAMAETAAATPWEDLLRSRVFVPLGMTSAGFGPPGTRDAVDAPRGHGADGRAVEPGPGADNPAAIGPAGTVHASLEDWSRFVALHLRRGKDAPAAFGRIDWSRLHEPPAGADYAMGWKVTERPWAAGESASGGRSATGRVLTHAGSNTMWYCVAWLAPERGFAVLAATNQGGDAAAKACDAAAGALIAERLGRAR